MTQYRRKGGPRGYRGGANRRHWSQAALGGVGALAARLARTRLSMKRTANALAKRKYAKKKTDVIGTFVKCKDSPKKPMTYRKKRRIIRKKKFTRAVETVIHKNLPRNIEFNSFSWSLGGDNSTTQGPDFCKWFQFAINALNNGDYTNAKGHAGYISNYNATGANPSGYAQFLYCATTNKSPSEAVSVCENPTIGGTLVDFGAASTTSIPGSNQYRWMVGPGMMRYSVKNVSKYGGTLELFYVRPKAKIANNSSPNAYINPGHKSNADKVGAQTTTNSRPTAYVAASQFNLTPLELANFGYCRQTQGSAGAENAHICNNNMFNLTDSKEFNDYFRVVWKCKAYVPPGGLIEKSIFERNGFSITNEYLASFISDSRTLYVVGRWIPEATIVTTVPGGPAPGIPQGDAEAVSVDLVGTVSYRQQVQQLPSVAAYDYTTVRVNMPTGLAATGYSVSTNAKT